MSARGRAHRYVPAVVRNKALAVGAMHWIGDLPELVANLERDWSIAVGHVGRRTCGA